MARPGLHHGQREVMGIILLNRPRHGEPWSVNQLVRGTGRQAGRQPLSTVDDGGEGMAMANAGLAPRDCAQAVVLMRLPR